LPGSSRSVSRVPGAAPRTSTPATAPSGPQRITVHPVRATLSWAWPTLIPRTSVIELLLGDETIQRTTPSRPGLASVPWEKQAPAGYEEFDARFPPRILLNHRPTTTNPIMPDPREMGQINWASGRFRGIQTGH